MQSILNDSSLFNGSADITTKEILKRYGDIAKTAPVITGPQRVGTLVITDGTASGGEGGRSDGGSLLAPAPPLSSSRTGSTAGLGVGGNGGGSVGHGSNSLHHTRGGSGSNAHGHGHGHGRGHGGSNSGSLSGKEGRGNVPIATRIEIDPSQATAWQKESSVRHVSPSSRDDLAYGYATATTTSTTTAMEQDGGGGFQREDMEGDGGSGDGGVEYERGEGRRGSRAVPT